MASSTGITAENIEDQESKIASKRFRFKHKSDTPISDQDASSSNPHRGHNHYNRSRDHRKKRRRTSYQLADDASMYDDSVRNLPPDQAFRESLFDALADDEGASFWQGVYGQPIHKYPREYQDEETGELEQMNDEEYASHIRKKMWERSWEGIEAAKEEKRREREREKLEQQKERSSVEDGTAYNNFVFDFELDASLRRGRVRKEKKHWQSLWRNYETKWNDLPSLMQNRKSEEADTERLFLRNHIAWPVESGKWKDVNAEEVRRFFELGLEFLEREKNEIPTKTAILKVERVKWHPDKIQQRFGFMELDEGTIKGVTAVFQVVDQLWNETRQKSR